MKANPAPLLTTLEISSICMLWAKLPRMPNIVMPAIRLVNVSKVVTINTSLLCVDLERVQIEGKKTIINLSKIFMKNVNLVDMSVIGRGLLTQLLLVLSPAKE